MILKHFKTCKVVLLKHAKLLYQYTKLDLNDDAILTMTMADIKLEQLAIKLEILLVKQDCQKILK